MGNNKKINLCLILSIVSIVLFIGIVICWILSTKDFAVVVPKTFESSCLGIISLAATFIVGYQIISTLDIKQTLKDNEDKLEKSKSDLQNDYDNLKKKLQKDYENLKTDVQDEISCLKKINEDLMKSLEIEKKQRELLYQETKVAMYHGQVIQNSSLALMEQIDAIKLILDVNKTEELKESIKYLFQLIKDIHDTDFKEIRSLNNKKIIYFNPLGLFKLDEYENEIKIKLRKLPQENEQLTKALILVEEAFKIKMEYLKKGLKQGYENVEKEIEDIYEKVDALEL